MNCNDPNGAANSAAAAWVSCGTIIEHKHCIQVVIVEIIVHPNPEAVSRTTAVGLRSMQHQKRKTKNQK